VILDKEIGKHNIAENLKRLMQSRGLTQQQLAAAAGISQPFVHQLRDELARPAAEPESL